MRKVGAFLFGYLVVRQDSVWRDLARYRWVGVGLACFPLPIMMLQPAHTCGCASWAHLP